MSRSTSWVAHFHCKSASRNNKFPASKCSSTASGERWTNQLQSGKGGGGEECGDETSLCVLSARQGPLSGGRK